MHPLRPLRLSHILAALFLPFVPFVAGCDDREPQVSQHEIGAKREVESRGENVGATSHQRFEAALPSSVASAADSTAAADPGAIREAFEFSLPAGWVEKPPAPQRHVNFAVGRGGGAECYLTFLPGGGGGVRMNVDRWRGQFGLADTTDAEFEALERAKFLERDAVMIELTGTFAAMGQPPKDGQAMIAAFAEFPAIGGMEGFAISLKLVGASEIVTAERDAFRSLVRTIAFRKDQGEGARGSDRSTNADVPTPVEKAATEIAPEDVNVFDPTAIRWTAPQGWSVGTGSSMRLVTLDVPGGAQCWVTVLSGGAGGLRANLDRWGKEMGKAELTDAELAALPSMRVLGIDAPWRDLAGKYQGMGGPKELPAESRMFAVACVRNEALVTIKMVGPKDVLEKERAAFIHFCESLEVGK